MIPGQKTEWDLRTPQPTYRRIATCPSGRRAIRSLSLDLPRHFRDASSCVPLGFLFAEASTAGFTWRNLSHWLAHMFFSNNSIWVKPQTTKAKSHCLFLFHIWITRTFFQSVYFECIIMGITGRELYFKCLNATNSFRFWNSRVVFNRIVKEKKKSQHNFTGWFLIYTWAPYTWHSTRE